MVMLALFLYGASTLPMAQTTRPADESFLRLYAVTRRFQTGRPVGAEATPDGQAVLFLRAKAKAPEQSLYLFDVASGQSRELLTPDQLLKGAAEGALSIVDSLGALVEGDRGGGRFRRQNLQGLGH